jgi:putative transposase
VLNAFQKEANNNSNKTKNQFWQQLNKPIGLWSIDVIKQKLNYIHNTPVASGFVD